MKVTRKIIQIDEELCDGCGNCVVACAEGAMKIIDGKAKVIADKYCDGLGACIGDCPQDALKIIERDADEFDEEAVEELLKQQKQDKKPAETIACGCPSSAMKMFPTAGSADPCGCANKPSVQTSGGPSALGHWPVQIKLVPAGAPFLKNADLLIAADCVPVAYPSFHKDFLKGKAIMIGCPKFDNADEYVEKLAQVFKVSGIKSITSVVMEVPCCSGMPVIIKKALQKAGMDIPFKEVVVSARGEVLA
ncbi:MAG: 4Fe-4S binding protein [Proteobacteria bacterium]|nr:4Fe-4S binding protein [Pseudomonadota bacterium]MBU1582491.1 4Fe-4S binding protein [Pseudomonadota bacterium]MBU2452392.1 4Fe-4S binding protein [Pseudomonadota bacterium]MBU2630693.1 4Fe-4S binding protein [Pseudomonadota bacterium]